MKTIEEINQSNVKKILSEKKIPAFYPGDVVKVGVRITEGKKERIQYFEGVCIAKKSRDINSSFTVRKISFGEATWHDSYRTPGYAGVARAASSSG